MQFGLGDMLVRKAYQSFYNLLLTNQLQYICFRTACSSLTNYNKIKYRSAAFNRACVLNFY